MMWCKYGFWRMRDIEFTRWFIGRCVVLCVQVGRFVGGGYECKLGGGWLQCECVGRQKGLCGSCLNWVTSMHYIKSLRILEDDIPWPEHALVIQGGPLGGLGWWSDVCKLKNVCLHWAVTVLASGFFRLVFLRVYCEYNRPSFLVTVFNSASVFNRDLNVWDVATVTTMYSSKSIRIFRSDLTWRQLMLMWLEGSVGVWGWCWWCFVKMVERCWRMREIECTPMVHVTTYVICA